MPELPTVAVLGSGIMGGPMAGRLLDAGLTVRVWNRTASKAQPLVDRGATRCDTPAEAAGGADFVLTMLADGPTVHSVMTGEHGALGAMSSAATWLQTSTVGIDWTGQLAELAAAAHVTFVDCPVLGTRQPAEQGKLVVLEGGPAEASERCRPVFDAIGQRIIRVGEAGAATRLKLVCNNWVLAVTNSTAECVAFGNALGIDPGLFLDAISGGALDCAYAHVKGNAMINEEYSPSFPLHLAAKDTRLILEARDGADLAGAEAALAHLERAEQLGHRDDDMAALYYGCAPAQQGAESGRR